MPATRATGVSRSRRPVFTPTPTFTNRPAGVPMSRSAAYRPAFTSTETSGVAAMDSAPLPNGVFARRSDRTPNAPLNVAPGSTLLDGWLVIRIVTVQAYLRYEDITGQGFADAPCRGISGPRIVYGVKWSFLN